MDFRFLSIFILYLVHLSMTHSGIIIRRDNGLSVKKIPKTRQRVANWTEESGVNPEELGDHDEGDMLRPKHSDSIQKGGWKAKIRRWPDGVIPYVISAEFSPNQKKKILKAIKEIHQETCIRFVRKNKERDYVDITAHGDGCSSDVGYIGGVQVVNLQLPACVTFLGTIIHELMHAMGMIHEHTRDDRDKYIKINWENIRQGYQDNFKKYKRGEAFRHHGKYDYDSVMHYSCKSFSANGNPTIYPKQHINTERLGQRVGMSPTDIMRLNKIYKCHEKQNIPKHINSHHRYNKIISQKYKLP